MHGCMTYDTGSGNGARFGRFAYQQHFCRAACTTLCVSCVYRLPRRSKELCAVCIVPAEAGDKVRVVELSREQTSALGLLTGAAGATTNGARLLQVATGMMQVRSETPHKVLFYLIPS